MLSLRLFQASSELSSFSTILWRAYLDIFAIKYFNKWEWFNDPERDRINREVLDKLGYKGEY